MKLPCFIQERLQALLEERKRIIDDPEGAAARTQRFASASKAVATQATSPGKNDMVEKEAKRLEVMKRRQERELGQMVSFEVMRKAMQVGKHHLRHACSLEICMAHTSYSVHGNGVHPGVRTAFSKDFLAFCK